MREAVENLLPLERDLFFVLNGSDSVFLDNIMWTVSGRYIWIPLYLFVLFLFFYKTPKKEAFLVTFFLILVFVACDQVSSAIFKPLFERFRPTHHPDFKELVDTVNGYKGGLYGFISGHATNSFGFAVFILLVFKNRLLSLVSILWAGIISYSRIYLGVHFISDVVAGIVVGVLIALLLYKLYVEVRYLIFPIPSRMKNQSVFPPSRGKTLGLSMGGFLIFCVIFGNYLATLPH